MKLAAKVLMFVTFPIWALPFMIWTTVSEIVDIGGDL